MGELFCKPGDIICYGPRMTKHGFAGGDLSFQTPDLEKRVYPNGTKIDKTTGTRERVTLNPGLYYVSSVYKDAEHFSTLQTTPCISAEATTAEIYEYLNEHGHYSNLAQYKPVLRKCWDVTHTAFIYSYGSDKKAFRCAEDCSDPRMAFAFEGLDPKRDGFYPFNPRAILLVKTNTGAIRRINAGRYTPHFLYNTFPIAETLKEGTTVDELIDMLYDMESPEENFTVYDYMIMLSRFNRDKPIYSIPHAFWLSRRLILKAKSCPAFVVSKANGHITIKYLCPESEWKNLKQELGRLGYACEMDEDLNGCLDYVLSSPNGSSMPIESEEQCRELFPGVPDSVAKLANYGLIVATTRRDGDTRIQYSLHGKTRSQVLKASKSLRDLVIYLSKHNQLPPNMKLETFGQGL